MQKSIFSHLDFSLCDGILSWYVVGEGENTSPIGTRKVGKGLSQTGKLYILIQYSDILIKAFQNVTPTQTANNKEKTGNMYQCLCCSAMVYVFFLKDQCYSWNKNLEEKQQAILRCKSKCIFKNYFSILKIYFCLNLLNYSQIYSIKIIHFKVNYHLLFT